MDTTYLTDVAPINGVREVSGYIRAACRLGDNILVTSHHIYPYTNSSWGVYPRILFQDMATLDAIGRYWPYGRRSELINGVAKGPVLAMAGYGQNILFYTEGDNITTLRVDLSAPENSTVLATTPFTCPDNTIPAFMHVHAGKYLVIATGVPRGVANPAAGGCEPAPTDKIAATKIFFFKITTAGGVPKLTAIRVKDTTTDGGTATDYLTPMAHGANVFSMCSYNNHFGYTAAESSTVREVFPNTKGWDAPGLIEITESEA